MSNELWKKLRGIVGESIAETLVSLLIAALAMLMLAGAVGSAANVITTSKEQMNAYYATDISVAKLESTKEFDITIRDVTGNDNLETLGSQAFSGAYTINNKFKSKPVVSYSAQRVTGET